MELFALPGQQLFLFAASSIPQYSIFINFFFAIADVYKFFHYLLLKKVISFYLVSNS